MVVVTALTANSQVKRFHEADIDKSGVLSLIEMLQHFRLNSVYAWLRTCNFNSLQRLKQTLKNSTLG